MRRLIRWLQITVALIFLFEVWLWHRLKAVADAIVARLPLRWLKSAIARWVDGLSPAWSPIVFLVPLALLMPFKIGGFWLLERGHWISAVGSLICAKLVGLGSTAFVFEAAHDKLLQLRWFRAVYDVVMAWRAWSRALVAPVMHEIEAKLAAIKAKLRLFAPGRGGRTIRLIRRLHRRRRAPMGSAGSR
jgi:hypothetical protein